MNRQITNPQPERSAASTKEVALEVVAYKSTSPSKKVESAVPSWEYYALEGAIGVTEFLKEVLGETGLSIFPGAQQVLKIALALMHTCQVSRLR